MSDSNAPKGPYRSSTREETRCSTRSRVVVLNKADVERARRTMTPTLMRRTSSSTRSHRARRRCRAAKQDGAWGSRIETLSMAAPLGISTTPLAAAQSLPGGVHDIYGVTPKHRLRLLGPSPWTRGRRAGATVLSGGALDEGDVVETGDGAVARSSEAAGPDSPASQSAAELPSCSMERARGGDRRRCPEPTRPSPGPLTAHCQQ